MSDGPYRGGAVHVLASECKSCIFRSVNDGRIHGLAPGRVAGMVQEARELDGSIHCHSTLYRDDVQPAVCRGFFDLPWQPPTLQLAVRIGIVTYDPPPD